MPNIVVTPCIERVKEVMSARIADLGWNGNITSSECSSIVADRLLPRKLA